MQLTRRENVQHNKVIELEKNLFYQQAEKAVHGKIYQTNNLQVYMFTYQDSSRKWRASSHLSTQPSKLTHSAIISLSALNLLAYARLQSIGMGNFRIKHYYQSKGVEFQAPASRRGVDLLKYNLHEWVLRIIFFYYLFHRF